MGRGASKAGGGSTGGGLSAIKTTLNRDGVTAAGDMVNNMSQSGDIFVLKGKDGSVTMYGKTYNDEYYPLDMGGKGVAANKMDSDAMAKKIATDQSGKWKLSKYQGDAHWQEKPKNKNDSGQRSAVIISELPTNVKATKVTASIKGYDIYELSGAPDFFKKVAVKKGR